MKPILRPTTPADAAALAGLFAECGMDFNPSHLSWKYWQPHPDWVGSRSYVIAQGEELVAHAGIVPGTCSWAKRRVRTLQAIDWVARARSGAGVMLLKHLRRMTDVLLGIGGGAETRSILPHLGFRPAGAATAYARPLFPLRLLRGRMTWRLPPRLARAAWRYSAPVAGDPDWQVRCLAGDEVGQIEAVLPAPASGIAVMERTVGQLHYMLGCPIVPMRLYGVERAGRVRGYFLLASLPRQIRIVDCWIDSDASADWQALILCAVAQAARDPEAAEVVMWANDPLLSQAARACGFYARVQYPILVRPADDDSMPEGTLRVQMLDLDDAFLSVDPNEYWG